MDNQTLELQVKASAESATSALNKLIKELGNFKAGYEEASGKVANFSNVMFSLGKLTFATAIRGFNKLYNSIEAASDRAEDLNLFNVVFKNIGKAGEETFSKLGLEATRFQNNLAETFGTNKADTLRYQALFQSMGQSSNIGDKYAYIMSENLTKLTYDLASLYNSSEKSVAEALKSGIYAGQTKPLRKYGVDVTQGSIAPLLEQLGIDDRTMSQMNQAEKQILRYINTMRQAQVAMGDFADTIESPANQLKILRNQFAELRVAIGNLFVGIFAQILPYANAILMVLKEIARAIANIFGIEVSDYNSGLGVFEESEEALDGVGKAAGGASKAVKELNRQTLKFDQINNIKSPTKSGSGGGGGVSGGITGGIDKRLLDAIKGYDNLMGKVKMKATEIRDRWMDILGFKKIINPLTGEVSFKYQGFSKTIEGLAKWFSNLSAKAKLFIGLGLAAVFHKIYSAVGGVLGKVISADSALGKLGTSITNVLRGLGIAGGGLLLMNTGLESIAENGATALNVLETLGGSLGIIYGLGQAGYTMFGTWGAVAGMGIGLVASLVNAIKGIAYANDELQQSIDKTGKLVTDRYDEWQTKIEELKTSYSVVDSEMGYYQNLYNELTQIVDENGKIKDGYEERAAFITGELSSAFGVEIKTVDGVIQKYGELKGEIEQVIEKEKNRLKLIALEEKAKEAIKEEGDARKELKIAEDDLTAAQEHYNKVKGLGSEIELDALNKLKESQDHYNTAKQNLDNYTDTIREWEHATGLAATNNQEALTEYFAYEKDLYGKSEEEKYEYWDNMLKENKAYLDQLEKDRNNYSEEEYKARKKQYDDLITLAEEKQNGLRLTLLTQQGILTNDMVLEWQKLGKESSKDCLAEFEKLPKNMQNELYDKMVSTGEGISNELQAGLDKVKITKTVEVGANTSSLTTKLQQIANSSTVKMLQKLTGIDFSKYLKAEGGVLSARGWSNIPQFANGGSPSHGTLFAAGENGAEIVGNINRRTEVLNRSQIASAIYSAVSSAMSNANIGGGEVHLYAHTDEGVIIDRINSKTKQTGVCPINIPA